MTRKFYSRGGAQARLILQTATDGLDLCTLPEAAVGEVMRSKPAPSLPSPSAQAVCRIRLSGSALGECETHLFHRRPKRTAIYGFCKDVS